MINEQFYDEMKETLIKNINDTFTLNLAISLLEDSKKYKVDSEFYKQGLKEIKSWLKEMLNELKQNDGYDRTSYEAGQIIATECIVAKIEEMEQGKDE